MKYDRTQIIVWLLGLLLVGGLVWMWFSWFEQRWVEQPMRSEAATNNPMLAATRLLENHKHRVAIQSTLGLALFAKMPHGTMILADNAGVLTAPQVDQLLAWVARGNTLIAAPTWSATGDGEAAACPNPAAPAPSAPAPARPAMADLRTNNALGERFGIAQAPVAGAGELCRQPWMKNGRNPPKYTVIDCVAAITLPGAAYPLRLDSASGKIGPHGEPRDVLFSDQDGLAVRAYAHGKGRMIFVAHNYFDNNFLAQYDHAELLLGLTDLDHDAGPVLIVQKLDVPSWYRALWAMLPLTIGSAAVALLLLAWVAASRFGPVLPEPDTERRSLMEHVEAGGRWLWKTGHGRDILLTAARIATDRVLARRAPELRRLPPNRLIQDLALQCGLTQEHLDHALLAPPASLPAEFTRQIQTLQRLRKHYER